MPTVLVTGGTGTLGKALVPALVSAGYDVRVLSRRAEPRLPPGATPTRGDLATGAGLAEAAAGATYVVHAASDPAGDPRQADVEGTRRLLAALDRTVLRHVVYVSIVGVDRNPLPLYQAKLAAEQVVRGSDAPWSILRATQFHEFVENFVANRLPRRLGAIVVPRGFRAQPVATTEVADHLVSMLPLPPRFLVEDFGGPQVRSLLDLARAWRAARGVDGRLVAVPFPGKVAAAFRHGSNLCPDAARGRVTFDDWLRGETVPPAL